MPKIYARRARKNHVAWCDESEESADEDDRPMKRSRYASHPENVEGKENDDRFVKYKRYNGVGRKRRFEEDDSDRFSYTFRMENPSTLRATVANFGPRIYWHLVNNKKSISLTHQEAVNICTNAKKILKKIHDISAQVEAKYGGVEKFTEEGTTISDSSDRWLEEAERSAAMLKKQRDDELAERYARAQRALMAKMQIDMENGTLDRVKPDTRKKMAADDMPESRSAHHGKLVKNKKDETAEGDTASAQSDDEVDGTEETRQGTKVVQLVRRRDE